MAGFAPGVIAHTVYERGGGKKERLGAEAYVKGPRKRCIQILPVFGPNDSPLPAAGHIDLLARWDLASAAFARSLNSRRFYLRETSL